MANWNPEANEIFADALEIQDGRARSEFIANRCGGDDALRNQVESLLNSSVPGDDYLSRAIDYDELTVDLANVRVSPGTVIGNYKLLEQIGEGGFGVVYMAEQKQPVRRKVALKIIKAGMDTKEVIARFEAERQALAMMEHPNIAKVLDAGATDAGRPYFVMELVKGVPITEFCDENHLSTDERLRLFISVCFAIQHAHQKAIIHRDIKPSNVLVTMHDDMPVPKVIDFGIAKCTQSELTQKTIFTQFRQLLGTPSYMAPEQAQMSGFDIDTRCDVYALGVLLYELLTGVTPFDAKDLMQGGLDEICRRLREDEPLKPSSRVSTMDAKTRGTLAKSLKITPDKLGGVLRGDLDWIIMKAMEKNRTRRYETANGLASDVRRFLNCEPVTAVAPSLSYRASKFVQRNKTLVGMTTLLAVALVLGTILFGWQAYVAIQQRDRARLAESAASRNAEQAMRNEGRAKKEAERATKSEAEARKSLYISDMHAAQLAWEEANIARLQKLLDRHIPKPGETDLRGFEWYYYWKLCQPKRGSRSIQLSSRPTTVSFAADSDELAVVDVNGLVTVYSDTESLEEYDPAIKATAGIPFARLAKSGKRIAIPVSENGKHSLVIRDLESLSDVRLTHSSALSNAVFSSDGEKIATLTVDGRISVWNVDGTASPGVSIAPLENGRSGIAFSPDSRHLAVGADRNLVIWKIAEEEVAKRIRIDKGIYSVAFSSQESGLLLVGIGDGSLAVFRSLDWTQVARPRRHADGIRCVVCAPDGDVLATASRDNTINLWDLKSLEPTKTLKGHSGVVDSISFSRDGKLLASASQDYSVMFWDLSQVEPSTVPYRAGGTSGKTLGQMAIVGQGLYDLDDGAKEHGLATIDRPTSDGITTRVSSTGSLAIATRDGIEIWESGSRKRRLAVGRPAKHTSMTFSPDGRFIAIGLEDRSVHYWDLKQPNSTPPQVVRLHDARVLRLTFSDDGTLLASGDSGGHISILDVHSGKQLQDLRGHIDEVWSLSFHPSRKNVLISGGLDGIINVWQVGRDEPTETFRGHTAAVNDLVFSPDATLLLSAGGDRVIRMWDTNSWEQRCVLKGHSLWAHQVAFLNDRTIVSAGNDAVRIWRGATDDEVNRDR